MRYGTDGDNVARVNVNSLYSRQVVVISWALCIQPGRRAVSGYTRRHRRNEAILTA